MEYVGLVARFVLAGVFLLAGVTKLRHPAGFRAAVANYQVLPTPVVAPVAVALPWLEVVVGLALLLGVLIVPVAVLAAVVLVAFAAGIGINVRRGRTIGCGCGLARRQQVSHRLVVRNGVLAVAGVVVALAPAGALALWPGPWVRAGSVTDLDALGVLVATLAVGGLALLVVEVRRFLAARGSSLLRVAGSR
ncbi:MAG TPA: MauE/DoxX family redox-associated membrane protein [Jiangellales bacterium]|nr:MauE/DoxX family redox-associated membrane protein [Jiangellales bacterium]